LTGDVGVHVALCAMQAAVRRAEHAALVCACTSRHAFGLDEIITVGPNAD
jgi:hypothetical protein